MNKIFGNLQGSLGIGLSTELQRVSCKETYVQIRFIFVL